jgi:hypothetical protein
VEAEDLPFSAYVAYIRHILSPKVMIVQELKLQLINRILHLDQPELLLAVWKQLEASAAPSRPGPVRKAGFGKDLIGRIAPDFDQTPPGFEEYMP